MTGRFAALVLAWAAMMWGAAPAAEADRPTKSAAARLGDRLPLGGVIAHPDWVRRPDGEDLARLYPALAQIMELPGRAVLDCGVTAAGEMQDCKIVSETPLGVGFGDATLRAASSFVMRPATLDGAPVSGARVTIPISWTMPDSGDTAEPASSSAVPMSRERMTLGRKVAALSYDVRLQAKNTEAMIAKIVDYQNQAGAVTHPVERDLAVQAIKDASAAFSARYLERSGEIYAAHLTDAELAQAAEFLASPAGKALMDVNHTAFQDDAQRQSREMFTDARGRFCKAVECLRQTPRIARQP